jgi:hypothetical protein
MPYKTIVTIFIDLKMALGYPIYCWGCSSSGRAPPWHGGGSEFNPRQLHHFLFKNNLSLYDMAE